MNPVHRHDQHQCTDKGFSIHHLRLGPRARGSRSSPRPSVPKSAQARRFGPHGATPKKLACELTLIPIDFEKNNLQATHPSATVWRAFLSFACRTPSLKSPTTSRSHPQIPKTLAQPPPHKPRRRRRDRCRQQAPAATSHCASSPTPPHQRCSLNRLPRRLHLAVAAASSPRHLTDVARRTCFPFDATSPTLLAGSPSSSTPHAGSALPPWLPHAVV